MSILYGKDKNEKMSLTRIMEWARQGMQGGLNSGIPPELINAGEYLCAPNSAATGLVPFSSVSSGGIAYTPIPTMAQYNVALNAALGTTRFFISNSYYRVAAIRYVAKTAGTGTITVNVTKDIQGQAPGAGVALLSTPFDAVGTAANTVVTGTLTTANPLNLRLNPGDTLSVLFTGTITALAGVVVEVSLEQVNSGVTAPAITALAVGGPTVQSNVAPYFMRRNADISTTPFFIANRDMTITGIYAIYGTAFAGGVTIDVTKDTGTNAPGAGVSVLAAAMSGAAAINTLITPTLNATATRLTLAAGDRLSVKYSATTTGAGVTIVVVFAPIYDRIEQSFFLGPNAQQQVAQCLFIANRFYEVVDASFVGAVAAGGAATVGVTIDKGTTVPGGGNAVATSSFDANATANTVQFITPADLRLRLMSQGDRLGLVVTGAAQAIVNTCITVSLRPTA